MSEEELDIYPRFAHVWEHSLQGHYNLERPHGARGAQGDGQNSDFLGLKASGFGTLRGKTDLTAEDMRIGEYPPSSRVTR